MNETRGEIAQIRDRTGKLVYAVIVGPANGEADRKQAEMKAAKLNTPPYDILIRNLEGEIRRVMEELAKLKAEILDDAPATIEHDGETYFRREKRPASKGDMYFADGRLYRCPIDCITAVNWIYSRTAAPAPAVPAETKWEVRHRQNGTTEEYYLAIPSGATQAEAEAAARDIAAMAALRKFKHLFVNNNGSAFEATSLCKASGYRQNPADAILALAAALDKERK